MCSDYLEGHVNLRNCFEKRHKHQKLNLFDDDGKEFQINPKVENNVC